MYWVSIGHYEAVAVGNWWYWVSRGHSCLYILQKLEIWTGVTDAWLTTLKDRATQLLIKYKSGALVTQFHVFIDWQNCRPFSEAGGEVFHKISMKALFRTGGPKVLRTSVCREKAWGPFLEVANHQVVLCIGTLPQSPWKSPPYSCIRTAHTLS